jgi:hypothetical protein
VPLSAETLDNWFTFHAPTEEQKPKYKAITDAEKQIASRFSGVDFSHDDVNRVLREFVELIDSLAPDSADKTAAIRYVRLARNALNESIVLRGKDEATSKWCRRIAVEELRKARWSANSAIACGGK